MRVLLAEALPAAAAAAVAHIYAPCPMTDTFYAFSTPRSSADSVEFPLTDAPLPWQRSTRRWTDREITPESSHRIGSTGQVCADPIARVKSINYHRKRRRSLRYQNCARFSRKRTARASERASVKRDATWVSTRRRDVHVDGQRLISMDIPAATVSCCFTSGGRYAWVTSSAEPRSGYAPGGFITPPSTLKKHQVFSVSLLEVSCFTAMRKLYYEPDRFSLVPSPRDWRNLNVWKHSNYKQRDLLKTGR